jgi:outer membrane receptor for ferrienterochelin and colicins
MKTLLLGLCLLLHGAALAQSRVITGTVRNAESAEGLPFCNVVVLNTNTGTATDAQGKFKLTLPDHERGRRLLVSFTGFQADTLTLQPGKTDYAVRLRPSFGSFGEVVVTGTLREITKMESTIPVEIYAPSLFKKNPAPTLFESLHMITGVQPQLNCNVCNTGDIHINGLEGPYTMMLIDGMPIVSSLSSVYGLHGIPPSLVKRIEVVKGPASTLYGSEAVAGLINVITKDPGTSARLQSDVSATSLGEFNVDLSGKWQAGPKAASLLGVNYFNYSLARDRNDDNFTDVALQKRVSVFNKWSFQRKTGKQASLAGRYVHENRWGGEMTWRPAWQGTDSIYGESIRTNRFELIGSYELPLPREQVRLSYSYNYHLQDSYYGTTKYYADQHTAFGQLVWDKTLGKVNLLTGLPFRMTYYDDNSPATAVITGGHSRNQPAQTLLPGLFLQAESKLRQRFTTLAGLRYDHNNVHGSIWTPRLSFKYAPRDNQAFRLTGGSGYRVVNLFTEDHAALTGARTVVIQHALKPEKSWNVNGNYTGFIDLNHGYLGIDASLFYTYFTNQIVGDFLTDPQKILYDNLQGYAVSKGGTLNLDFSFTTGWKLIAGLTLLDVYRVDRDHTDALVRIPQLFAPAFSANYALSYVWEKQGLTFDWTGKINGPMHLPVVPHDFRPPMSPWYCLMNLQVTQRLPGNFEVYGGAKNLLNFIPGHPLLRPFDPFNKKAADPASNPFGYTFDPSYNYAPVQGIKGFLGVRWMLP